MRGADRTGEKVKIKSIRDNRLAFVLGDFFFVKMSKPRGRTAFGKKIH